MALLVKAAELQGLISIEEAINILTWKPARFIGLNDRGRIGVGMRGMTAIDALRRYGLLTIGDGLVTQIPALVLSTAAGILVTRVASERSNPSPL